VAPSEIGDWSRTLSARSAMVSETRDGRRA
jgi:hypothetical protein